VTINHKFTVFMTTTNCEFLDIPLTLSIDSSEKIKRFHFQSEYGKELLRFEPLTQLRCLGFIYDSCCYLINDLQKSVRLDTEHSISIFQFLSHPKDIMLHLSFYKGLSAEHAEMDITFPDSWHTLTVQAQIQILKGISQYIEQLSVSVTNAIKHIEKEAKQYAVN
jgi:hypothetical protein